MLKDNISVLVVDDDTGILDTLGKVMEVEGWKCFKAPTGEIGLEAFGIHDVDIVVLDIRLPRMSGFDVLKKMKELKPHVPVILATGLGCEKEYVDRALALGADGYVGKAMSAKVIISKIKTLLSRKGQ